jgi:hypothetical protein
MKSIFILLVMLFLTTQVHASRVTEMEFKLSKETEKYLKDIFGDNIISVSVEVKPLRRIKEQASAGETLPFLYVENQQVVDEWDNQDINIYQLYNRIASAKVKVVFKDSVDIQNMEGFKNNLLNYLKLKPGRDYVELDFQASFFKLKKDLASFEVYLYPTIIAILLITFFVWGLKNIQPKVPIPTSASGGKTAASDGAGSMSMPRPTGAEVARSSGAGSSLSGGTSNISLSDPTKTISLIRSKIEHIQASETFPNLNDMMMLNELVQTDVETFGYIIYEFSQEKQNEIFSRGCGDNWYQAYNEIGSPSIKCLNFLEKMSRNRNYNSSKQFEELLILCWRLGDKLKDVIAKIEYKDAMSILFYLPKSLSIPVARDVFPGRWADVLSNTKIPAITNKEKIESCKSLCVSVFPLLSVDALESYRKQRDLLIYLKHSSPVEEEDVYKILGSDSELSALRPPFYVLFDLPTDTKRRIVDAFPLSQWALALFNVPRDLRKKLDEVLNDKERYLLGDGLKSLDQFPPSKDEVGVAREIIAKYVRENASLVQSEINVEYTPEVEVARTDAAS